MRGFFEAAVEPHRAVERALLVDQEVLELVGEGLQIGVGPEVVLPPGPLGDGLDHASDQLLDRPLAFRRAHLAAEVFRDDDVRRLLGPEARHLDVALLEDDLALLVADDGGPQFPVDLVKRVDAGPGEIPRELETNLCWLALDLIVLTDRLSSRHRVLGSARLHSCSLH